ncbi:glutathione S-transferase family protein [Solimonas terrae]|uniref:Glutathione S-transferase family protein n=1 Tax=Solimonas terrae TaxID=1396819 RepID=A0A6M2BVU7_9GAMM|nr:glutathione S-transferase family protein [Solimonas terrae]NGY06608.1 glutathione S-transferase family protein [Solimonas terrae]
MPTLYGMSGSGNCYKPALLMQQLGLPFRWQEVDVVGGATREAAFLALNPNGKVPLLAFDDGRTLAESNAMLCYLADDTPLFPADRWQRAQILQWLFFEQYSHEPYIATVRYWVRYLGKGEAWADKIRDAMVRGHAAFAVMESQLRKTPFLAGTAYSIADIALYAYTHCAGDGGYRLDDYPQIEAWLRRVERQPGFVAMPGTP